jgi:hypothetical protein
MIDVSIDDFLYNYFLINKDVDYVSARDMFDIRMRVSDYNSRQKHFDDMVHLDFYQDDFQCVHLDFELSLDGNGMVKKKKPMTYDDNTIRNYMKLPPIVVESIKIQMRYKKIKQLRNKIYKEKAS